MMKLLLVEDDTKIAEYIEKGMSQAGFVVQHAADGQYGYEQAMANVYDVAIIDLMLPRLDGITLIERMREAHIAMPVLILSAKREVDDRVKGLASGGDDYLTKPFAFAELHARIQALIRRAHGTAKPLDLRAADLTLNLVTREVMRGDKKIDLSPLEFDLLAYLMDNAGHVVSKEMIIEHVWKYNFDPGSNLVEARVSKLRDKIDREHPLKLIHTVRGVGYAIKTA